MRPSSILAAGYLLSVTATGCAVIYGLDGYSVDGATSSSSATTSGSSSSTTSGSSSSGGGDEVMPPECTTNAECTAKATQEGGFDAGADAPADAFMGELDGGVVPAVCVKPEGRCVRLLTAECTSLTGDYTNENSILVATLLVTSGATIKTNIPRQQSANLAAEEINSTLGGGGVPPAKPGGPPRPLLVLACDASTDVERAGAHLITELHVPAIMGPNLSQDTLDLTTKLSAQGGTLLISPSALASSIAGLQDNGLTFRMIPSDLQRAKLTLQQVHELEAALLVARNTPTLKLGIIYRDDASGQSAFGAVSGQLTINGRALADPANAALVKIGHYDPKDVANQKATGAAFAAFVPDILAVFGTAESIPNVMVPIEQALTAANVVNKPYYVLTDSNRTTDLFTAVTTAGVAADFRIRVRGTGVTPGPTSIPVFSAFNTDYLTRYGSNPRSPGMAQSYDAMYAIAYALAATTNAPPTGASIAKGLGLLSSGGVTVDVGQNGILSAYEQLTKGQSINGVGTFGRLAWDTSGDVVGGTIETWCLGLTNGTPTFGSSGQMLDVATQAISGKYTQCAP